MLLMVIELARLAVSVFSPSPVVLGRLRQGDQDVLGSELINVGTEYRNVVQPGADAGAANAAAAMAKAAARSA